jgi:uroporphyrinogen decarboxylase
LEIDLCRGFGMSYEPTAEGSVVTDGDVERKISGLTLWNNPPIRDIESLKSYHTDLPGREDVIRYIDSNRNYSRAFAPRTMWVPGCNVGFDVYYSITGFKLFAIANRTAPEEMRRIMRERNDASLRYVRAAAEERLSPLFFIGEDVAYKGKLMFSPEYLRREFIPLLERLCRPLKDAGIKTIFHSDGYLPDDIIDALIEAGIDGLNPLEPLAGMDIAHLKGKYYGRLILVGNLDCSQVLPLCSEKEVVEETKRLIGKASHGGGHFLGSSSEITPSTPLQNILAFYGAAHRFGRYPIRDSC